MPRMSFDERAASCIQWMASKCDRANQPLREACTTAGEASRRWSVSRTHATRLLLRMCDEGYLFREEILPANGGYGRRVVYWFTLDCEREVLEWMRERVQ